MTKSTAVAPATKKPTLVKPKNKKAIKVTPNLSMKGKEIAQRLNNRTLILRGGGEYTTDPQMSATLKMSRADIHRARIANAKEINSLNTKLKTDVGGK